MNPSIDLSTCQPGQKLVSKHGEILTFVGPNKYDGVRYWYPYMIQYQNGSFGCRTQDGFVSCFPDKRLETDHDIVQILPLDKG